MRPEVPPLFRLLMKCLMGCFLLALVGVGMTILATVFDGELLGQAGFVVVATSVGVSIVLILVAIAVYGNRILVGSIRSFPELRRKGLLAAILEAEDDNKSERHGKAHASDSGAR